MRKIMKELKYDISSKYLSGKLLDFTNNQK